MSLKGKNVLVAGGSGLVGRNLTLALTNLGANVNSSYFSRAPQGLSQVYRRYDFTQWQDCLSATKDMDYVVICAALIYGSKITAQSPTAFIRPNLEIVTGLLEASRQNKVEKVVLLSSSTVYHLTEHPVCEGELDLNLPPYESYQAVGWFNRYIEQLGKYYHSKGNLEVGIIRPSNIYGPFDRFEDDGSHVLPALIKRALKKETPFVVWGKESVVRDFIFVEDFVSDLIDVLDRYCCGDPINSGSGEPMNLKSAVNTILDVCGHNVTPEFDLQKPMTIPYRALSREKFDSLLGKKKLTPFGEGIRKTVEWYRQQLINC